MIGGTVSYDGVPNVILTVAGQNWPATIDTGFNGDLELPHNLQSLVNPRMVGRMRSFLAGGQEIEEDNYHVDFPFDGQIISAQATFVPGNEILIGTHLLKNHRLEINFPARTVLLERVSPG